MSTTKKDHILQVAEELFAEKGYAGVSVRDITKAAGVRLASVNYYFETKENLYFQMLERRGSYISHERPKRLAQIDFEALDEREAITQICHAIVDPMIEKVMSADSGWRSFCSVIASLATTPLADGQEYRRKDEYDVLSLDLVEALQRYAPNNDARKAHYAFQFIVCSSLAFFSNNQRIEEMSEGKYRSDDYETIYKHGMKFIIGGACGMLLGAS